MTIRNIFLVIFFFFLINRASCHRCYKCKSVNYRSVDCEDPVTMYRLESRECPEGEKCVKITGKIQGNGQSIIVRDCYKTIYEPYYGYYRDMDIQYYNDRIDGWMYICGNNLCNNSLIGSSVNYLLITVIITFMFLFTH